MEGKQPQQVRVSTLLLVMMVSMLFATLVSPLLSGLSPASLASWEERCAKEAKVLRQVLTGSGLAVSLPVPLRDITAGVNPGSGYVRAQGCKVEYLSTSTRTSPDDAEKSLSADGWTVTPSLVLLSATKPGWVLSYSKEGLSHQVVLRQE